MSKSTPFQEPLCFLICLTLLMQAGSLPARMRARLPGRWWCGRLACGFAGGRSWREMLGRSAGEAAEVFCRPVVTAPAVVRRDGSVLAGAWLPDLVRLGELERHLGDGVIESVADAAIAEGRLRKRERRRIMSSIRW